MSTYKQRNKFIGCNIHPQMTPGGFSVGTRFLNKRAPERKNFIGYKEISQAASIILENRQMPRADEAKANKL